MYRFIISFFIFIAFISCNENNKQQKLLKQKNILPVEKFTSLMIDVQLLEGHLNTNRVNQVFIMDSSQRYYKEVFNRHGLTFEEYKENLKYYTAQPAVLAEVYTKVEEHLVNQERLYEGILIDQPAISPINRNQLMKIIAADTGMSNLILDSTVNYSVLKDSVFNYFTDSLLKNHNTNILSFQQSFNNSTHNIPLFRLFKVELVNKLEKINKND